MIAKCSIIVLLAAVAAAAPLGCQQAIVAPTCGVAAAPVSFVSGGVAGLGNVGVANIASSAPITRNIVAKGKYPVALRNCGPTPDRQIPVTTSQSTAPCQVKPTVRLPCNIPAPRVVAHSCTCYKTICRPRVHNHIVTVPTVQRYIETLHKPVVENIQYEAEPVNCNDNVGVQMVAAGAGCGVQAVQAVPAVQAVQAVPAVQTVQAVPTCQTIQVPQVQAVQAVPTCQTVQVPQVQAVQAVSVPQFQTVELPRVQTVQVPQSFSFGCSSSCNTC